MSLDRRAFLSRTLAAGSGLLFACGENGVPMVDRTMDSGFPDAGFADAGFADAGVMDAGMAPTCADPFAGGSLTGQVGFLNEDRVPLEQLLNQGWDGRLYTDLSDIDTNIVTPNERFYVRTRYPDLLNPPAVWTMQVGGLATATTISLDELAPMVRPMGTYVLECSGNSRGGAFGLMSAAEWSGVPVSEVFERIDIDPAATRVLISGFDEHSVPSANNHSTPGAAWIFTFEELEAAGAFFATEMNGVPLPPDHGAPVRLYVPNWYGCTCIKWVDEIRFVDEDEPATSQMREFASRTHQNGVPRMARDYRPATMDQAAMPIRIEKWRVEDVVLYRIIGIMWGGYETTEALTIRFNGSPAQPVDVCPNQSDNDTWTLWEYAFRPSTPGRYAIRLQIDDPNVPTIRLDSGYYERTVMVDEV